MTTSDVNRIRWLDSLSFTLLGAISSQSESCPGAFVIAQIGGIDGCGQKLGVGLLARIAAKPLQLSHAPRAIQKVDDDRPAVLCFS